MTNLVQFPGLGLSFELSRVAFSIGDIDIYWYGICIAFGLCLALVFAFRRCTEFGIRRRFDGGCHPHRRGAGHRQRPPVLCGDGTL